MPIHQLLRNWELPKGCNFHSDRGSQYTSALVQDLLSHRGILQSFSRVGKPGDNSWSESFFANLKKEAVHWTTFTTREEAKMAIFSYIDGFLQYPENTTTVGLYKPGAMAKQMVL